MKKQFNAETIVSIDFRPSKELFRVWNEDYIVSQWFGFKQKNLGKTLLKKKGESKVPVFTSDPFWSLEGNAVWHNDKHLYFIREDILVKKAVVTIVFANEEQKFLFKSNYDAVSFIDDVKEKSGKPESFFE